MLNDSFKRGPDLLSGCRSMAWPVSIAIFFYWLIAGWQTMELAYGLFPPSSWMSTTGKSSSNIWSNRSFCIMFTALIRKMFSLTMP